MVSKLIIGNLYHIYFKEYSGDKREKVKAIFYTDHRTSSQEEIPLNHPVIFLSETMHTYKIIFNKRVGYVGNGCKLEK